MGGAALSGVSKMQDFNAAFPNSASLAAQQVIGIDELSQLLHKHASTIIADRSRAPHRVPPSCEPPGCRTPLWIVSDVLAWLRSYQRQAVTAPTAPAAAPTTKCATNTNTTADQAPRRGRPTKAEQARRAGLAAELKRAAEDIQQLKAARARAEQRGEQ